jgi:selenocysteine lyase/cysteine desulfurase
VRAALGLPALRSAIAEAQNVPAAQVAVTPGAQAGLFLALKLLLGHDGGEARFARAATHDCVRLRHAAPAALHARAAARSAGAATLLRCAARLGG